MASARLLTENGSHCENSKTAMKQEFLFRGDRIHVLVVSVDLIVHNRELALMRE